MDPFYPARTNANWVSWLTALPRDERQLVFRDELWYYDEWVAGRLTFLMILEDAGVLDLSFA